MIIDKLENASLYYKLGNKFKTAFEYINNTDLLALESGKYEIDGKNIYIIIQDYNTKSFSGAKWEAHKKYTDIQYVIKGQEKIGWENISEFSEITEYDEEKDIVFLEGSGDFLELREGSFCILFPQDVHMPSISPGSEPVYVKKAVIKVKTL